MTDFFDDPDAVLAKIQRDIADAQARAERATEVRASIDRVRGRARSARGEVEAEVDATSRLTDLRLDDSALGLRADALAALIRETIAAATRDAGTRALAITDDAYGAGSSVSEQLRRELEERGTVGR